MAWTRRAFIKGLGAGGLAVVAASRGLRAATAAAEPILLNARPGAAQLLETPGGETAIWGYGARVPGPIIRAKRGGEIWVRLQNSLPGQTTTIHWHGVRIDNRMDGVAHLTQEAVESGATFDYRFTVPDAGTFWYHPHHRSWEQVERGLYGLLIVDETEAIDVDQDIALILDDWRLEETGLIHEASFGSLHDWSHAGRLGNVLTVNGGPSASLPVSNGERIRLRLCNTCNARILTLRLEGVSPTLIAIDGQPVPPTPLEDGRIEIAPGQRADLSIDMTGEAGSPAAITEISDGRLEIGAFVYGKQRTPARERPPLVLKPNAVPEPDLASAHKVDLVMIGGAMGMMGMSGLIHRGEMVGMRELAMDKGLVWGMNGIAGMPDKPLFSLPRGRSVVINMVNKTRWPHAMHFHGHHFRAVDTTTGRTVGPLRDTILLTDGETRAIAFLADNPGKWMVHCHMLEHQAAGMETWFEVT